MAPTGAPRLAARAVTVRFGGLTALDGVDIAVPAGQVTGLLGPNGAGKSTLFAVLSGLLRPDAGQVLLDGDDVSGAGPETRARRGLARTFQHPELFGDLTVREHVVLAHRARFARRRFWTDLVDLGGFRRPPAAEDRAVDEVLELVGLAARRDQPVLGQPLGISRLVELARALALSPTALLLDEPSSGLDGAETEQLAAVVRRVAAEQDVGVLLVEHDVELVFGLSTRVTVLDFGVRIAEGPPAALRRNPAVRAAYLGEEIPVGEPEEETV